MSRKFIIVYGYKKVNVDKELSVRDRSNLCFMRDGMGSIIEYSLREAYIMLLNRINEGHDYVEILTPDYIKKLEVTHAELTGV